MIRWAADALAILLVALLLLFFFAVVDSLVGAIWNSWSKRKSRRVGRSGWFTSEELARIREQELDRIRADQKQAFMDGQVSRYLARKRW